MGAARGAARRRSRERHVCGPDESTADLAEHAAQRALDAAGLAVLGAYGQTEHLCVAMHRPDAYDTASAGPPCRAPRCGWRPTAS